MKSEGSRSVGHFASFGSLGKSVLANSAPIVAVRYMSQVSKQVGKILSLSICHLSTLIALLTGYKFPNLLNACQFTNCRLQTVSVQDAVQLSADDNFWPTPILDLRTSDTPPFARGEDNCWLTWK